MNRGKLLYNISVSVVTINKYLFNKIIIILKIEDENIYVSELLHLFNFLYQSIRYKLQIQFCKF